MSMKQSLHQVVMNPMLSSVVVGSCSAVKKSSELGEGKGKEGKALYSRDKVYVLENREKEIVIKRVNKRDPKFTARDMLKHVIRENTKSKAEEYDDPLMPNFDYLFKNYTISKNLSKTEVSNIEDTSFNHYFNHNQNSKALDFLNDKHKISSELVIEINTKSTDTKDNKKMIRDISNEIPKVEKSIKGSNPNKLVLFNSLEGTKNILSSSINTPTHDIPTPLHEKNPINAPIKSSTPTFFKLVADKQPIKSRHSSELRSSGRKMTSLKYSSKENEIDMDIFKKVQDRLVTSKLNKHLQITNSLALAKRLECDVSVEKGNGKKPLATPMRQRGKLEKSVNHRTAELFPVYGSNIKIKEREIHKDIIIKKAKQVDRSRCSGENITVFVQSQNSVNMKRPSTSNNIKRGSNPTPPKTSRLPRPESSKGGNKTSINSKNRLILFRESSKHKSRSLGKDDNMIRINPVKILIKDENQIKEELQTESNVNSPIKGNNIAVVIPKVNEIELSGWV